MKWHENEDVVRLMKVLNSEQCYKRLPYPPFSDLMFTDEHFAKRVEDVIPDKRKRIKAIKCLRDATGVASAICQFDTYLRNYA